MHNEIVDWIQKFEAVLGDKSYAQIERAVGWRPNTLSTKIKKRQTPAADAGIRLARALRVSPDWLFDDSRELPADPPYAEIKQIADLAMALSGKQTPADQITPAERAAELARKAKKAGIPAQQRTRKASRRRTG